MGHTLLAILIGFGIDLLVGDPHAIPHPVVLMGKLISALERSLRRIFPATVRGERAAGGVLWLVTAGLSFLVPWLLLRLCGRVSPWLALGAESVMAGDLIQYLPYAFKRLHE